MIKFITHKSFVIKATTTNFDFVLILAAPVDKSSSVHHFLVS